jgi:predicted RNase H-like HicB family nuclease
MRNRYYPAVLHCYARPENGHYIAVCLELNLCDRGETLEEAKASLEEDIVGYVKTLTPEELPRLFPRYAPVSTYLDYYRVYLILLAGRWMRHLEEHWATFAEPLFLMPRLAHG